MQKILIGVLVFIVLVGCSFFNESKYDAPSDHTVSEHGAKHKPGLKNPTENCVGCHGADLKGSSDGPSCYECHGKKW